jgi:hypothetical protein
VTPIVVSALKSTRQRQSKEGENTARAQA